MISLKKLLSIPRFSALTLVSNENLLNHQVIQSVEITETPDIANFIPHNVLILSTGMAFEGQQEKMIPFIDSLIDAKAIGLGIKINRFLKEIDPEVIAHANKNKFPIFIIPDKYQLGSILHQIMNVVWDTKREEIEFALDIQKSFSNLLVQNASNELLVNEFSQMVKAPILLLNPFKEIIAQSSYFNNQMNRPDYYLKRLLAQVEESERDDGLFTIQLDDGQQRNLTIVKIQVYKYFPHYLIVFDSEKLSFPISVFAIDQAALVFQYNLFKNAKLMETQFNNESYFFDGLINSEVKDSYRKNWHQLSHDYDYIESDYYQVIKVYTREYLDERTKSLQSSEKALLSYQWLRNHINDYFPTAMVIWRFKEKESIIILQKEAHQIQKKLKAIMDKVQTLIDSQLNFSIGRSFQSWEKIEQSYIQANLAHGENPNKKITFYRDKGIYQLFNEMDNSEIIYFCKKTLKDFAFPDEEDDVINDLRHTLDVYLAHQCEITTTANVLFIHRNTVKYRINRCEEILGIKVNDPTESLNLRLALNLSKLDL